MAVTDESILRLASSLRANVIPLGRALKATDSGLTPTQLSVLGTTYRNGPINMGELAEKERLSPAMVSRVVQALVESDLVERTADERDRRVCLVRVSAEGLRWIDKSRTKHNAWLAERLARMSAEERRVLEAAVPLLEALAAEGG